MKAGRSDLILEVSSWRLVLAPAIIAAKITLCSRTRTERKLGNGRAAISTAPISFYHRPLEPSFVFLFHSNFEVQLDYKNNLDVPSPITTLFLWLKTVLRLKHSTTSMYS